MNWLKVSIASALASILIPTLLMSSLTEVDARAYLMSSQKMSSKNINFVPFPGGAANVSAADVGVAAKYLATAVSDYTPTAGGTMTINGASLGSYDYRIVTGNQTISSFSNTDWFTTTADSRSAWVIVKGNLTINSGQTFIPSNRKLFTVVFVTGNLTVNGSISMTARGANHSASGSNITAAAIKIATGTYSSVTDPSIAAACATGGAAIPSGEQNGNPGNAGTAGCTGGGGGGSQRSTGSAGGGAQGTSFSGGPGAGGSISGGASANASANGGAGSNGSSGTPASQGAGSGAGNPAGVPSGSGASAAAGGTGGTLIIIALGTYSGSGTITCTGSNGGPASGGAANAGGGASGGGSCNVLYGTDSAGPTPTASGGTGGASQVNGGNGGAGSGRKLGPYAFLRKYPANDNHLPLSQAA